MTFTPRFGDNSAVRVAVTRSRTHLQRALALEPDLARAHYHLGALYAARGDVEAAQRNTSGPLTWTLRAFYGQRAEKALNHSCEGYE